MGVVLIWILFGIACMLLAGRYRRHRLGWFLIGFLFGPFVTVAELHMGIVLIWILFGIACMLLAGRYRRHRLGWFLIGFLFGPFGLLCLLCAGKRQAPTTVGGTEPSAGELACRWNEYARKPDRKE